MSLKLAVILGLTLLVVIGFALHWWIVDVRRIWDWLVYAEPEPADLPGPVRLPARGAGEHHPTADEWEQLDPDVAADVWVAELHEPSAPYWMEDGPGTFHRHEPEGCPVCAIDATRDQWWNDPDLVVWDAKRQAARCWEILHVEFPRLRAELCGVAA